VLTTHPLLAPRSRKSRATHPLGHLKPVMGLLYLYLMRFFGSDYGVNVHVEQWINKFKLMNKIWINKCEVTCVFFEWLPGVVICWSSNVADARNRFVYCTELYVFSKYVVPKLNPLTLTSAHHTDYVPLVCCQRQHEPQSQTEDSVICLWLDVSADSGLNVLLSRKTFVLAPGLSLPVLHFEYSCSV
jgi:hypothetical protein